MTAPPYDPSRCSLHYLAETLAVAELDLRVVCEQFGYEVSEDGHITNGQAFDVRAYLDPHCARSVPEWSIPGRRQGDVDERGLGAPHDRG